MRELTQFGSIDNLLDRVQESEASYQSAAAALPTGDAMFAKVKDPKVFKFDKATRMPIVDQPVWLYGPDQIDIQEDTKWAVDPASYQRGWSYWPDDEESPVKRIASWTDHWPEQEHKDESRYYSFRAVCVESSWAEEIGTVIKVESARRSDRGGLQLEGHMRDRLKVIRGLKNKGAFEEAEAMFSTRCPVITFGHDGVYKTKGFGWKVRPVIHFTGEWVTKLVETDAVESDEAEVDDSPEPREEQVEAPRRRTRRAAAETQQAEAEQPETNRPAGRRRPRRSS